jgi:hypothetical protein
MRAVCVTEESPQSDSDIDPRGNEESTLVIH